MSDNIIELENISKRYKLGFIRRNDTIRDKMARLLSRRNHTEEFSKDAIDKEIWALNDISFNVREGEVVGIIGPNGAGKSTLLKVISRITEPTSGQIILRGKVSSLLEVGTGFHPELSGRENIFVNGSILQMSRNEIKRKFDEIVAFSGIEKFIDTPVKRYSSGMYVRLAFSVAAHLEPDILIVDEVLAVGDVEFRKKCLNKMQDISSTGRTILFVSHNMAAIRELVDRCLLINQGALQYDGKVNECINKYLNLNLKDELSSSIRYDDKMPSKDSSVVIRKIRLVSRQNEESSEFNMGDDLIIEINTFTELVNYKFKCSIAIKNEYGIGIYHYHINDSGIKYFESSNIGLITMTIKEIKLYPGKYFISVWLGSETHPVSTYDLRESALSFEVHNNSGEYVSRRLANHKGLVYDTAEWNNRLLK